MKKILTLFLTLTFTLFGMSYKTFKSKTLKHSKILKSQNISLQNTQQKNKIRLRTANPTLTLESSRFDIKNGNNRFGYGITVSQDIRTSSYMNGLNQQTQASVLLSKAFTTQGKAGYIKTLEKLYTQYVFHSKMLTILKQEYKLSKHVTNIVYQKYKSGSETRVAYLQAKTETLTLKTQMFTTKQQSYTLYYQLLALAGVSKNISLEKKFIYSVSSQTKNSSKLTPKQQILEAKQKLYQSNYTMNKSSFRKYNLYTNIEKEPDQSIIRIGINIPLSIYNNRNEERMLAKLKIQQTTLDNEQLNINIVAQKKMKKVAIRELSNQYYALRSLQKEQKELSSLLQEGYKIAKGSLFELMTAKNKLIQTRKALLQTQKLINNQKIELRFLQGYYND